MNRFEPLSDEELTAAEEQYERMASSSPNLDGDTPVMPVPADAPVAPAIHPTLGNPSSVWKYPSPDGKLLFEVHRFDPRGRRKVFLPLSLWRKGDGGLEWKWKHVPSPRPLYRLDWLAVNPGFPALVCEGEKATDAVANIFREHIATTSPGGSQAAGKADWSPLAGRRVVIWPDNDEPGAKYAREVAAKRLPRRPPWLRRSKRAAPPWSGCWLIWPPKMSGVGNGGIGRHTRRTAR
jgi:hypothetical protein